MSDQINPITGLTGDDPKTPEFRINPITGIQEQVITPGRYDGSAIRRNTTLRGESMTDSELLSANLFQRGATKFDQDEARALGQDTSEKWVNGLAKAGITFGGAMLENTLGIAAGVLSVATGGQFFDTQLGRWVDEANAWGQENLPNYQTQKEKDTINMWSANFWADKVLNGAAYSVASMVSMMLPAGGVLGNLTRMRQLAKSASTISKTKAASDSMMKAGQIGKRMPEIQKALDSGLVTLKKLGEGLETGALHAERMLGSAMAESAVEARELKNDFMEKGISNLLDNKRKEYLELNPDATEEELSNISATPEELENIRANGEMAGTLNFITNAAIVGTSNIIMFGKMIGGDDVNNALRAGKKNISKVGYDQAKKETVDVRSKFQKFADKFTDSDELKGWEKLYIGAPLSGTTEALQEGSQFISKKAYGDFFEKRMNGESVGVRDMLESFGQATIELGTTKEGIESMLIGFIVGGGSTATRAAGEFAKKKSLKEKKHGVEQLLERLNDPDMLGNFSVLQRQVDAKELTQAEMDLIEEMEQGKATGNRVKYGSSFGMAQAVSVMKHMKMGSYEAYKQKLEATKDMTEEDFNDFFGTEGATDANTKNEMVDAAIEQMEIHKKRYNDIQAKYGTRGVTDTAMDRLVKAIDPEFYKEYEIEQAFNNFRVEQVYMNLSKKDWLDKQYSKLDSKIKEVRNKYGLRARRDGGEGLVSGQVLSKNKNKDNFEESINYVLSENAAVVQLVKEVFKNWKADNPELLAEFGHTAGILKKGIPNLKLTEDDFIEVLQKVADNNPAFFDVLQETANNIKEGTNYAAKESIEIASEMVSLARLEAELEWDESVLSGKPIQESLFAEMIKNREARVRNILADLKGPRDMENVYSELSDEAKKNVSQPKKATTKPKAEPDEVEEALEEEIQDIKDNIKEAEEELKNTKNKKDKKVLKELIAKLKEELKKESSELGKRKKERDEETKAAKGRISVNSSTFFQHLVTNYNDEDTTDNLNALRDLTESEIIAGLEIRIEKWTNKRPQKKDRQLTLDYGFPGLDAGIFVYHNGNKIGGLMHPDSIKINGNPIDVESGLEMGALNKNFVTTTQEGEKILTAEGKEHAAIITSLRNIFAGATKIGDIISSKTITKEFHIKVNDMMDREKVAKGKFEDRPEVGTFLERDYDLLKITELPGAPVLFKDSVYGKIYEYTPENGYVEITSQNPETAAKYIEYSKFIMSIPSALRDKIRNRMTMYYKSAQKPRIMALDYNTAPMEDGPGMIKNLTDMILKIQNATKEEVEDLESELGGKLSDVLRSTADGKKVFISSARNVEEGIEFYLNSSTQVKKGDKNKVYLGVKVGNRNHGVNLDFTVSDNGVLQGAIYREFTKSGENTVRVYNGRIDKPAITTTKELVDYLNAKIEEAAKIAQEQVKKDALGKAVIEGISIAIEGAEGLQTAKMVAKPGLTLTLQPRGFKNKNTNKKKAANKDKARNKEINSAFISLYKEVYTQMSTSSIIPLMNRIKKFLAVNIDFAEDDFTYKQTKAQQLLEIQSHMKENNMPLAALNQYIFDNNIVDFANSGTSQNAKVVQSSVVKKDNKKPARKSKTLTNKSNPNKEVPPAETEEDANKKIDEKQADFFAAEEDNLDSTNEESAPFKLEKTRPSNNIDIEKATENIKELLGDSVSVEEIDNIARRFSEQGITASQFVGGVIKLAKGANQGTEYHEAFHAVFRMFLTNEELDRLYAEARKLYTITDRKISKFIAKDPVSRAKLSREIVEMLYLEEQLADAFEKHMKGVKAPPKGFIARIFAKIKQFVNWLSRKKQNDYITTLFEEIGRGKYKEAAPIQNYMTNSKTEAFQLLQAKGFTSRPMLRSESSTIISDIASRLSEKVIDRRISQNSPEYKLALIEAMNEVKAYYAPSNWKQEIADFRANTNAVEANDGMIDKLFHKILVKYNAVPKVSINEEGEILVPKPEDEKNFIIITEEVDRLVAFSMATFYDVYKLNEEEAEEQEVGESWRIASYQEGGYDRMGEKLKALIQFAKAPMDEFGLKGILDMTNPKYHRPLQAIHVYNGIIRGLIDTKKVDMLSKYRQFVEGNPESSKFFQLMAQQIAEEANENMAQMRYKKEYTVEDVMYANAEVSKELMEYSSTMRLFTTAGQGTKMRAVDVKYDDKTGNFELIYGDNQDVGNSQLHVWRNNFASSNLSPVDAIEALELVEIKMIAFTSDTVLDDISNEGLHERILSIRSELATVGIDLHYNYIKYSLIKDNMSNINSGATRAELRGNDNAINAIEELIDYASKFGTHPTLNTPVRVGDTSTSGINFLISKANDLADNPVFIYSLTKEEIGEAKGNDIKGKLLKLAEANAAFDEGVSPTTYQNMDGEMVQTYGTSFYYSEALANLKTPEFRQFFIDIVQGNTTIEDIRYEDGALTSTINGEMYKKLTEIILKTHPYLIELNPEEMMEAISNAEFLFNGGGRNVPMVLSEEESEVLTLYKARTKGKTYASLTTADKISYYASLYSLQNRHMIFDKNVTFARINPGVNEAKGTQYNVKLPIFNMVSSKGDFSVKGLDMVSNMIDAEFQMIAAHAVENQMDDTLNLKTDFKTVSLKNKDSEGSQYLETLKNIAVENAADGYTLDQILNDEEVREQLEINLTQEQIYVIATELLQEKIDDSFNLFLDPAMEILEYPKDSKKDSNLYSTGLPVFFATKSSETKFRKTMDQNAIKNWIVNDFIGAYSFDSLINFARFFTGTETAKKFVKRYAMGSAKGNNMGDRTTNIRFKSMDKIEGVEVGGKILDPIDSTDGINYGTMDWFIGTYAKSRGANIHAIEILQKIRRGISPTTEQDWTILNANKITPQSIKIQINSAYVAIKSSLFTGKRIDVSKLRDDMTEDDLEIFEGLHQMLDILDINPDHNFDGFTNKATIYREIHKFFEPRPGKEEMHNQINEQEAGDSSIIAMNSSSKVNYIGETATISNTLIREQVESSGQKRSIVDSTQTQQLIPSEIAEDAAIKLRDISQIKGEEAVAAYKTMLAFRINRGLEDKKSYLLDTFGKTEYKYMLQQFQESLSRMGVTPYVEEMFSSENGIAKFDLNFPSIAAKYEAMFISMIDKGSLKHKVKGTKFVLVPDFGYKKANGERLAHRVLDKKTGQYFSEVMVSSSFAKSLGLDIGDAIPDAFLEFFGVRIPTQDKHSMGNFKVVEFLDASNGNTIIMPFEIIGLSGADFDIDSLYAHLRSGFTNSKGKFIQYGAYLTSRNYENAKEEYYRGYADNPRVKELTKKGIPLREAVVTIIAEGRNTKGDYLYIKPFDKKVVDENRAAYAAGRIKDISPLSIQEADNIMLDLKIGLLHNDKNEGIAATAATRKNIEARKEVYISIGKGDQNTFSEPYSFANKILMDEANASGSTNISVAAILNTTYQFFAGQSFKKGVELFGRKGFEMQLGENGEYLNFAKEPQRINDLISQLVSAQVDAANEEDPSFFNMNKQSLSVAGLMVATGYSIEAALDFINQPIVLEFNKRISSRDNIFKRSKYISNDTVYNDLTKNIKDEAMDFSDMTHEQVETVLFNELVAGEFTNDSIQKGVLKEYINAVEFGDKFSDFQSITSKLKGRKASFADVYMADKKAQKVQKKEEKVTDEFPFEWKLLFKKNPHLRALYKSMAELQQIEEQFILLQNEKLRSITDVVIENLSPKKVMSSTERGIDRVRKHFTSYLYTQALKHSVPDLINKGFDILFDRELTDLVEKYQQQLPDNSFLKFMQTGEEIATTHGSLAGKTLYKLAVNTRKREEARTVNEIIDDFTALMHSDNEEVVKLAKMLIEYILIKDGFIFKNGSFTTSIEPQILKKANIFDTTNRMLEIFSSENNEQDVLNLFGKSITELRTEFQVLFTRASENTNLLHSVYTKNINREKAGIKLTTTTLDIPSASNFNEKEMNGHTVVKKLEGNTEGEEKTKDKLAAVMSFSTGTGKIYVLSDIKIGKETINIQSLSMEQLSKYISDSGRIVADAVTYYVMSTYGSKSVSPYYLTPAEWEARIEEAVREANAAEEEKILTTEENEPTKEFVQDGGVLLEKIKKKKKKKKNKEQKKYENSKFNEIQLKRIEYLRGELEVAKFSYDRHLEAAGLPSITPTDAEMLQAFDSSSKNKDGSVVPFSFAKELATIVKCR